MPTIRMNREQMQGGYTVLPNQILRTREMSYKARYLLAQMLSMSEAWQYTVAGMARSAAWDGDAVRTAMVELETLGYLARSQSRANGRFSHNVYIIREVPVEAEAAPAEAEPRRCPKKTTSQCPPLPPLLPLSRNLFLHRWADSPLPVSTLPGKPAAKKEQGQEVSREEIPRFSSLSLSHLSIFQREVCRNFGMEYLPRKVQAAGGIRHAAL